VALATDHPVVETGDTHNEFEGWVLEGVSDTNSDRGRYYVVADAASVQLYRERYRQAPDLVAQGAGAPGGFTQLTEVNGSGLSGRVYRNEGQPTNVVTVYYWLCNGQDLREFDDEAESMLIEGEVDFNVPLRECMRQFLIMLASIHPPPPGISPPLRFVATEIEDGREGTPEWVSQFFWTLTGTGDWELTGLQNATDYRSWAIYKTLEILYDRRARAGDTSDPVYTRARFFEQKAKELWYSIRPWVDIDRDQLPDRQPKIRSHRLRRG